ncbi:site-2 protease family protein [Mucilaginibacter humi]|uniref:site-2 protease family protein n=1 Tax=Mucilaginibacter humi TaxID=2732510 RepID=UPI00293BFA22|nr:site-2 protease family protein [Mucilaginibacter humi]
MTKGDSVIAVNGTKIAFYDELQTELKKYTNKSAVLDVKRKDEVKQLTVSINKDSKLGIAAKFDLPKEKTIKYGFFGSLPVGASKAWGTFSNNAKAIGKVFKGEAKFNKVIGGPVAIATMFGSEVDWVHFWTPGWFLINGTCIYQPVAYPCP